LSPEKEKVGILLGSQIKKVGEGYVLAPHTLLKAEATALAYKEGTVDKVIVCGGSNFGIRYDDNEILAKPDFSFRAFAGTNLSESEAVVIKQFLVERGVSAEDIFTEGLSATTEENIAIAKIILKRRPMFSGEEEVFIISLLYHLERVFSLFKKAIEGAKPLFAEDVLARNGRMDEIISYYSTPKGGKQYDIVRMRELLSSERSLEEML